MLPLKSALLLTQTYPRMFIRAVAVFSFQKECGFWSGYGAHRIGIAERAAVRVIQAIGVHATAVHTEHAEIRIVTVDSDTARSEPIPHFSFVLAFMFL